MLMIVLLYHRRQQHYQWLCFTPNHTTNECSLSTRLHRPANVTLHVIEGHARKLSQTKRWLVIVEVQPVISKHLESQLYALLQSFAKKKTINSSTNPSSNFDKLRYLALLLHPIRSWPLTLWLSQLFKSINLISF